MREAAGRPHRRGWRGVGARFSGSIDDAIGPRLVDRPSNLALIDRALVFEHSMLDTLGSFGEVTMCRNIKTLFNFEPPATELEIRDASLQFVRKLSGFSVPSRANEEAFERAVEEVAASARFLVRSLVTSAEPRSRQIEAARAKARSAVRFGAGQ
jgi:hypothetical protein